MLDQFESSLIYIVIIVIFKDSGIGKCQEYNKYTLISSDIFDTNENDIEGHIFYNKNSKVTTEVVNESKNTNFVLIDPTVAVANNNKVTGSNKRDDVIKRAVLSKSTGLSNKSGPKNSAGLIKSNILTKSADLSNKDGLKNNVSLINSTHNSRKTTAAGFSDSLVNRVNASKSNVFTKKKTIVDIFGARKTVPSNVTIMEEKGPPKGIYSELAAAMMGIATEKGVSSTAKVESNLTMTGQVEQSGRRSRYVPHTHRLSRRKSRRSWEVAYVQPPTVRARFHKKSRRYLRQGSERTKPKVPESDDLECEFCDKLMSSSVKRKAMKLAYRAERTRGPQRLRLVNKNGSEDLKEEIAPQKTKKEIDDMFLKPELLSPYSVEKWLRDIAANLSGINATTEIIGKTISFNDIVLLKMTSLPKVVFRSRNSIYVDEPPAKKILFIVHGLSTQGMNRIPCLSDPMEFEIYLQYYAKHLDKFDIFIVPIANPDGFAHLNEYGEGDLSWHKNLSPQIACSGVNVDRNFDVAWDHSSNITSCSQFYPGPQPFSEPESRAIRRILHTYSQKIVAYIHVHGGTNNHHTYKGDAILYPKGYSDVATDEDKYLDMKGEIDEAMKNGTFQVVSVHVDSLYNWYGKVLGTSVDYASTVYGIPYAMEFVMQVYANNRDDDRNPSYDLIATDQIWRRVIDVVFNSIYNGLHLPEEEYRRVMTLKRINITDNEKINKIFAFDDENRSVPLI